MKTLLLGSGASPYLFSLIKALQSDGSEVDLIDPYEGWIQVAGSKEKAFYHGKQGAGLSQFSRATSLAKFLNGRHYDVCNVHYNSVFYGLIPESVRRVADRLVVSIWGSDMRGGSAPVRFLQKRLLHRADVVTINNPDEKGRLIRTFDLEESKVEVAFMPLETLDEIDREKAKGLTGREAKKKLGLRPDSTIILCGTNARESQQHLAILESLEAVNQQGDGGFSDVQFLFPLTYAKSSGYIEALLERIGQSGLPVTCLTEFLSLEDLFALRIACEGVIQVQTEDMFSAVMQEALYAGSWVITGSWLPYAFLRNSGAGLIEVDDVKDVGATVVQQLRNETPGEGRAVIRKIAGMETGAKMWTQILGGI